MKITTLIGPLCSGKTFRLNNDYQSAIRIDVGDIVRSIKQKEERIFDAALDMHINAELGIQIRKAVDEKKDLVIAGIRQLSIIITAELIIKALALSPKNKIQYTRIFLNIDTSIRKQRFISRESSKDNNLTFEEIEKRDNRLGLQQLQNYCLIADRTNTTIINS